MVQVCGGDVTCLEAQRWEHCFDLRTFGLQSVQFVNCIHVYNIIIICIYIYIYTHILVCLENSAPKSDG